MSSSSPTPSTQSIVCRASGRSDVQHARGWVSGLRSRSNSAALRSSAVGAALERPRSSSISSGKSRSRAVVVTANPLTSLTRSSLSSVPRDTTVAIPIADSGLMDGTVATVGPVAPVDSTRLEIRTYQLEARCSGMERRIEDLTSLVHSLVMERSPASFRPTNPLVMATPVPSVSPSAVGRMCSRSPTPTSCCVKASTTTSVSSCATSAAESSTYVPRAPSSEVEYIVHTGARRSSAVPSEDAGSSLGPSRDVSSARASRSSHVAAGTPRLPLEAHRLSSGCVIACQQPARRALADVNTNKSGPLSH